MNSYKPPEHSEPRSRPIYSKGDRPVSDSVERLAPGHELTRGRDLAAENRRKLAELFPGLLTETAGPNGVTPAIDVDVLRDLVGATVDHDTRERFGLSWHGKSAARRLALTPSAGTLRPDRTRSVDWDTTGNVLIEGDNLEVLKLLQKSYAGKIKLIYIDPPYNTGNDFVYKDDFRDPIGQYQRTIGDVGEEGAKLTSNADSGGRFHTNWLSMIHPRLLLARELLREDGVIFVSIDDVELANCRLLMDEIFGAENFIATVIWQKVFAPKNTAKHLSVDHDYVVIYARNADKWTPGMLPRSEEADQRYKNPDNDPRGLWASDNLTARNFYGAGTYPITCPSGRIIDGPPTGTYWRVSKEIFDELNRDKRIWWGEDGDNAPRLKRFLTEVKQGATPQTLWKYSDVGHTQEAKKELIALSDFSAGEAVFDTPKPTRLIGRMLEVGLSHQDDEPKDEIILDFFAGSGTTGHAVMAQNAVDGGNRKFVLVQLPEPTGRKDYPTIADLTAERLRRAGAKIKAEHAEKLASQTTPLDTGFRVFKLDSANVRAWEAPTTDKATAEQIGTLLEGAADAIKPDRTDDDLLWGVMLNLGLAPDSKVEARGVSCKDGQDRTIHIAGGGTLLCCFAKAIDAAAGEQLAEALATIAREKGVEGELTVVFRDSAFGGKDAAKVNLVENLKQRLPESVTKSRVLSI